MWHIQFKEWIELYSGLDRDTLHVHGALFLYFLALVLFRQTRRSRLPWLFVLAVELVNEGFDFRGQGLPANEYPWDETVKDLWNTMLWPTVLLLMGRYTTLFERSSWRRDPVPDVGAGEALPGSDRH
jgi:hypothetical protein